MRPRLPYGITAFIFFTDIVTLRLYLRGYRLSSMVRVTFKQSGFSVQSCITKLFDSCVLPVCLYGASVWGHKEFSVITTIQNKACRFVLGVPTQSPNVGTQGEMGWCSMLSKSKLEVARLWCRLTNVDEQRLSKHVFQWSCSLAHGQCKNWVYTTCAIFEQFNVGGV